MAKSGNMYMLIKDRKEICAMLKSIRKASGLTQEGLVSAFVDENIKVMAEDKVQGDEIYREPCRSYICKCENGQASPRADFCIAWIMICDKQIISRLQKTGWTEEQINEYLALEWSKELMEKLKEQLFIGDMDVKRVKKALNIYRSFMEII